ncbi:MAG: F0F1 ATP synthase subunit delta [Candidatus Aminicenantes bacterium]
MEIDLFTFIAQIINFLILVLLLRHFLYKRVVKAMDERERRISDRIKESEHKKKEAEQEAESHRLQKEEFRKQHQERLEQSKREAEGRRKEMLKEARQEVEKSRNKWHQVLQRQKAAFLRDLRRRAGQQMYEMARKVLNDLADQELERHMAKVFIQRVKNLEGEEKKEFQKNIQDGKESVLVKSAFPIPEKMKKELENTVKETMDMDKKVEFKQAKNLICGIELEAGDRKIAWTIDSYLSDLEEDLSEFFKQKGIGEEKEEEKETDKAE